VSAMSFTSFSRIVGCNFSLGIAIYQIDSMSFPLGKHRSLALVEELSGMGNLIFPAIADRRLWKGWL